MPQLDLYTFSTQIYFFAFCFFIFFILTIKFLYVLYFKYELLEKEEIYVLDDILFVDMAARSLTQQATTRLFLVFETFLFPPLLK